MIEVYHIVLNSLIGVAMAIGLYQWRRNIRLLEDNTDAIHRLSGEVRERIHKLEVRTATLEAKNVDVDRLRLSVEDLRKSFEHRFWPPPNANG